MLVNGAELGLGVESADANFDFSPAANSEHEPC